MISKSFFRQKSTRIYLMAFIIIILLIFILNYSISYLNHLNNKNYIDTSFLYIESNKDFYQKLKAEKYIKNIIPALTFEYSESDEIEFTHGQLTNYELGEKILVFPAKTKKIELQNNEVVIGLHGLDYINTKEIHEGMINKNINFIYENCEIDLVIKNIKNSKRRPEIIISDGLFQKLKNNSSKYIYVSNIIDESQENKIIQKYTNIIEGKVKFLSDNLESDIKSRENIQNLLFYLKTSNYILIIIFIFLIWLINKNIINDLSDNCILEYRLGFNRNTIKNNILKRLLLLHLKALIAVSVISLVIVNVFVLDLYYEFLIYKYIIYMFLLIVIIDILSVTLRKHDFERR